MQYTDDSNGARPCIDPIGEGRLLRKLQDGFVVGQAAVRSLRLGGDRPIGTSHPRAVGPGSNTKCCYGGIADKRMRAYC